MRILIIGSLAGELGRAARIASSQGARVCQADDVAAAMVQLRANATQDLVLLRYRLRRGRAGTPACRRTHGRRGGGLQHIVSNRQSASRQYRTARANSCRCRLIPDLNRSHTIGGIGRHAHRDRARSGDAGHDAPGSAGGTVGCLGADHRRVRHRKGGSGAPYPPRITQGSRAVRGAQLRSHSRASLGE